VDRRETGLAPGVCLGASYAPGDGYIDPPRNVLAYSAALLALDVDVREHCRFTGLRTAGNRVTGIDTDDGPIDAAAVVLTGGPDLAAVGRLAGVAVPVGGTRHQVVVTAPLVSVDVDTLPMVFDVAFGIYWRPGENGGLLWGMSNPAEPPGPAREFDTVYFEKMSGRIAELLPAAAGVGIRKSWAATIDYTPDHLPIIGPVLRGGKPVQGTVIAAAGGHGMMWGPGVSQVAADLVLHGRTDLLDISDLGLDRFDAQGRSRLVADPIALPFPPEVAEPAPR
jgi:sarcosine oxidase subunit beta